MAPAFLALEGPNGVGKTTTAQLLVLQLRERNAIPVQITSEPTDTPLGRLLRSSECDLRGRALALGIAADRYAHLEQEIGPALAAGKHVLSDRYVQSSLVLQRLDGLALDEIWEYNRYVLVPTASFYLHHEPSVIAARLAQRGVQSRLELVGSPGRELQLYDEAFEWLAGKGWPQHKVDCRNRSPAQVARCILDYLDNLAA
jgi:dTMP kinase